MKLKIVISAILLGSLTLHATADYQTAFSDKCGLQELLNEQTLTPIEPSYLEDSFISEGWKSNWFIGASGGGNVFLGSPLGCEDMFGRLMPALQIQAGKWFTPSVGSRLVYQGLRFKDCQIRPQDFASFHMDLLWNPFGVFYKGGNPPRFDAMPYVGVGFIHPIDHGTFPFAFSYGIQGRYRVTDRFHITMELGGTTTFKDFDGYGAPNAIGDNLLSLTAGVSLTIGKAEWKRVIDPKPYIDQNERLMAYAFSLRDRNLDLMSRHNRDLRMIGELKKIIRIEGLLRKYGSDIAKMEEEMRMDDGSASAFPKNDYSGLNSLMARLKGYGYSSEDLADLASEIGERALNSWDICDLESDLLNDENLDGSEEISDSRYGHDGFPQKDSQAPSNATLGKYVSDIISGKECIGAPIYFFFRLGTANLTDESQLINLDEIARIAVKYDLTVHVIGAADSATGNDKLNINLSTDRAAFIAHQLKKRGISDSRMKAIAKGGIADHSPTEANRHTRIELRPSKQQP